MSIAPRILVELAAGAGGRVAVPERLRIFRAGRNESRKGPVYFTGRSAELVMANFQARGVELRLDYEHASHIPLENQRSPAEQSAAAAFFRPEVDEAGDLYVVFTRWSQPGRSRVEGGEFRYLSPTVATEPMPEGGEGVEVVDLVSMALTNHPALEGAPALFSTSPPPLGEETRMSQAMFKAYMMDKKMGRETLCNKLGLKPDASDQDVEFAFQARMLAISDPFAPPQVAPVPVPPPVVGMSADEVVMKLTGASNVEEAKGRMVALLSASQEVPRLLEAKTSLEGQVAQLRSEVARAQRRSQLDALVAEARITPAQRDVALPLSDEAFEGFLKFVPEKPLVTPSGAPQPREQPTPNGEVTLSAQELAAFQSLGHFGASNPGAQAAPDPKDWLEFKKKYVQDGGWQPRTPPN